MNDDKERLEVIEMILALVVKKDSRNLFYMPDGYNRIAGIQIDALAILKDHDERIIKEAKRQGAIELKELGGRKE